MDISRKDFYDAHNKREIFAQYCELNLNTGQP